MTQGSHRHTQIGCLLIVAMIGGAISIFVLSGNIRSSPVVLPVIGVLLLGAALFYSLTVEIREGKLRWHFGPGLIRGSVNLNEIASAEPFQSRWYYGWGIHWTPRGWLYNVSGLDAVHVRLRSGKEFCLGTDEPERLCEAIMSSMTASTAG